jgi:hypothetical protein
MLVLMLPFRIVAVRVIPSDFESASSAGDRKPPPSDESREYQAQRSDVHDRPPIRD